MYVFTKILRRPRRWQVALGVVFWLLLSVGQLCAQGVLQRPVALSVQAMHLPQALRQLAKQNEVPLAFSDSFFPKTKLVTVEATGQPLGRVLDELLLNTGVGYREVSGQVVLFVQPKEAARQMTLSGLVEDAETGERLIAAAVFCPEHGTGTVTNEYGFYSLTVPAPTANLRFSYIGYGEETVALEKNESQRINMALRPSLLLAEVVVVPIDSALGNLHPSPGSMRRFKPEEFQAMPDLGGQNDLFRAMHLLPGMQTGADGLNGLFVRGGNADQNLVLMDGVPVYNSDHLMGLFSIFNTSAIRSAKLLKGGMPARYGGRISSVVDVYTKEGNQNRWTAEAGADLIGAKATVEGPLPAKIGSVMVSGRHSHSDFYLMPVVNRLLPIGLGNEKSGFGFYDLNTKINVNLSSKDKVYLSFYQGNDDYKSIYSFGIDEIRTERNEFKLDWGNTITSMRWNHLLNAKMFANTSLTFSRFKFSVGNLSTSFFDPGDPEMPPVLLSFFYGLESDVRDFAWKTDFEYAPSNRHYLRMGASATAHRFRPNALVVETTFEDVEAGDSLGLEDFFEQGANEENHAVGFDAYIEDEWRATDRLSFNAGVRLAGFRNDGKTFLLPEPRLSAALQLNKKAQLTASVCRTTQFLHRVATATLSFPSDFWVPADQLDGPQKAWQATLGAEGKLVKGISFSAEAYFKQMTGLLSFSDSFLFDPFGEPGAEPFYLSLKGRSQGIELLMRREEGRAGGWVGYALSKTTRQADSLNNGQRFDFYFDRRHELKLFGYFRFSQAWQASLTWSFGSPNPKVADEPLPEPLPGPDLSPRSTAFHRLDLAIGFYKKTGRAEHHFKLSALNVYNRKNVAFYTLQYDDPFGNVKLEPVHLLPFMPGVAYSLNY